MVDRRDCVEWTGAISSRGYGRRRYKGREWLAHRAAWDEQRGQIPPGMLVLHKCDNPPCTFIEHLFLGTHQDNMDDMVAKGRGVHYCGPDHPRSGLTQEQVAETHKLYLAGERQKDIAARYGVTQATISRAVRGVTYSAESTGITPVISCAYCGRVQPRVPNYRKFCDPVCCRSFRTARDRARRGAA